MVQPKRVRDDVPNVKEKAKQSVLKLSSRRPPASRPQHSRSCPVRSCNLYDLPFLFVFENLFCIASNHADDVLCCLCYMMFKTIYLLFDRPEAQRPVNTKIRTPQQFWDVLVPYFTPPTNVQLELLQMMVYYTWQWQHCTCVFVLTVLYYYFISLLDSPMATKPS